MYLTAVPSLDLEEVVRQVSLGLPPGLGKEALAREMLTYALKFMIGKRWSVSFYRHVKIPLQGGEVVQVRAHPDFNGGSWYDWVKASTENGSADPSYYAYRVLAIFSSVTTKGRESFYVFAERYTLYTNLEDVKDLSVARMGCIDLHLVLADRVDAERFAVLPVECIASGLWTTPSATRPGHHWVLMH